MTSTAQATAASSGNMRGIAAITAGMAVLVFSDVLVKLAGATLPLGQLLFLRGVLASALITAICWQTGVLGQARQMLAWQVSGRALANFCASLCYITALINMPIANLSAIMQASPLLLTALAALLLGERVGWRRWLAIAIGFCGVLMIIRPATSAFNVHALFALGAIGFVCMRDLFTKVVKADTPSMLVTLATAVVVTTGGGLLSLYQGWVDFGGREIMFLVPAAFCTVAGYHFVLVGFRPGGVAVVAPFRFSMVLWATIAGYLVWSELPDGWTLAGAALVIGMGLYTFHRERLRRPRGDALAADTTREI